MPLDLLRHLALLLCLPLAAGILGCGSSASPDASPSGAAARPAFNLDLYGTDSPPDTLGAAAQQPGPWNACPPGTTSGVVDSGGTTTALVVEITGGEVEHADIPPETDFGRMTRTSMISDGDAGLRDLPDLHILVSGLAHGSYDVYYYSAVPFSGFTANGVSMNPVGPLSIGWPESIHEMGPQGTNWDVVRVVVTDGTLTILDTSPGPDRLSGLQIVPVP